ncbi:MAG: D-tyrosyl-tRNA(Tyr) deacylase [Desulfobulbaceae bacterium]|uniref:D-aminoacyl-tRNA deacylase n=1 Tax=Candidatus Desulfobia pelagia TaxID=2841692 RepID=A0A8J6NHF2_9BACT|nr:D-tyrosyl-tRNA(Tyr) deacylase [Candidatus Desulfobia pelagia]
MRAVVQRVTEARVTVDGEVTGAILAGVVVLLGVTDDDSEKDVHYLVDKIANLRIFPDAEDKMNLSLLDIRGEALIVSQFTLLGDCRKGRRPSYAHAAPPELAKRLYELFIEKMKQRLPIACGRFQTMMQVHLINDGPVTLLLDSRKNF